MSAHARLLVETLTVRRWDDSELRAYLEEKGVVKTKTQARRDELLARMRETYARAADPVWRAWSDSYIVGFLLFCCGVGVLNGG